MDMIRYKDKIQKKKGRMNKTQTYLGLKTEDIRVLRVI